MLIIWKAEKNPWCNSQWTDGRVKEKVLTHARQMRAALRHIITFISTRPAAGAATTAPARARGLAGCISGFFVC